MLATRLSRPLSRLPGKTLSACDRENGARATLGVMGIQTDALWMESFTSFGCTDHTILIT
ncbi:3-hydroxybutyrate dehydrogenase 1 [Homo sapiens]|uniref:3-hydroxybutyrate dehydrogenase 1 n=1 Tax=Homo sapiens TaxID=9606 RepID=A0A494C1C0_HUMAN|nr:3-hydroxybutyrate dehydrogenase 1 [Homo sapiens]KAI4033315.1 3-hydroxybutyrate dehydrogenase 1 [Homo sapiens]